MLTKCLTTITIAALIALAATPALGSGKTTTTTWKLNGPAGGPNPIMNLPVAAIETFTCIIWAESRSTWAHLNLKDNDARPGASSGIFQIEQATWAAHQAAAHVPARIHVWQATPHEQELVAAAIWRADGFGQWTRYDGC
jgi:hypothetical protein